jgi:hypothetical protein
MRRVRSTSRTAAAATSLLLAAVVAWPALEAGADAGATLVRVGNQSGGPGAALTYTYTWDAADCAKNSPKPRTLRIVLHWDDSVTTPIGFQDVTYKRASAANPGECDGTVTGQVPSSATAGDHLPSAALEDPSRGDSIIQTSTAMAAPGQQFTVVLPSTPTPTATPSDSPTPTDTPLPSDTSAVVTLSAAPSPSTSTEIAPVADGNGRSGPPTTLLVALGVLVVLAAVGAAAVVAYRRHRRGAAADPFEFLR